jgi:hypothetical protein
MPRDRFPARESGDHPDIAGDILIRPICQEVNVFIRLRYLRMAIDHRRQSLEATADFYIRQRSADFLDMSFEVFVKLIVDGEEQHRKDD